MQPVTRAVPNDIHATIVRILAYIGALAMLAVAAASLFRPPAGAATVAPAPHPEWTTIDRPHPAFELNMPELSASPADYAILRRNSDGARKDVLSWGEIDTRGPYVMVEIERPGSAGERFLDAPSEVASRILTFEVTDDVKAAGEIDSKFGAVDLVDFAIAAEKMPNARARRCLGFARPFTDPAMQLAGWYCNAGDDAVDRATLACLLDRLSIVSAGGDEALAGLFARAEVRRTFCGQRSPILAATPEHEMQVATPRVAKAHVKLGGHVARH